MMTTSAFRIPLHLLGDVYAYPLTPEIEAVFAEIATLWRRRTNNEHARAPYASLATSLSAVTGRPVTILDRPRPNGERLWMITTAVLDPAVLTLATGVWERCARGGGQGERLASLLAAISPRKLDARSEIENPAPGRVAASNWVFRVLGWNLAQVLGAVPIDFDGRRVPFRLDTAGDLVAWDDPIEWRGARGLIKISFGVKTLPGLGDLVCLPEISLARLVGDFRKVKAVWIDHGRSSGGSALLRLPVVAKKTDDGWSRIFRDYSGTVVERCGLSPLPWNDQVLVEHPDQVRAWRGVNWAHPLGVGVGSRSYRRVMEHMEAVLGMEPITCEPTSIRVPSKPDGSDLSAYALDAAIAATGTERLRIVHLSGGSTGRERIRAELERLYGTALPAATSTADKLTARSEFVAYDLPDLLEHGETDRSGLFDRAPALCAEPGTQVLALVDTEYDGVAPAKPDAKPTLRGLLARQDVPAQFIVAGRKAGEVDYAACRAMWDLFRAGGLCDDRLARAARLERDAWLVGIHVRVQNGAGRPTMVKVLVAVHAYADLSRPWKILLHVPGRGWLPHALGLAAFHRAPIGATIEDRQRALTDLRGYVDGALAELPGGDPVVVMVNADQTRRVWAGLTDPRLGEEPLPGSSLAHASQIAVVRIGTDDTAVPRPVHHTDGRQPADSRKPATPRNRLYLLHGDGNLRVWLLGQTSRTFDEGPKGRVGVDYTRFTLPPAKLRAQGDNWHSFTATEVVVARNGAFDEESLVAVAARLCAQPLSWDGRTREPVPLHLARSADKDHPSYRSEYREC
ncbi:RNaseH domain-containing protein [Nonomuraea sp. NPDC059023]|uniref:RNaseH domain-containing protein n=1 Tax=unclassified Nonomuraea TaxID=2593643 RepID=UPI00369CC4AE